MMKRLNFNVCSYCPFFLIEKSSGLTRPFEKRVAFYCYVRRTYDNIGWFNKFPESGHVFQLPEQCVMREEHHHGKRCSKKLNFEINKDAQRKIDECLK